MIVVVPFGRPAMLGHVLSQWRAQTVASELVLVSRERGWWSDAARAAGATALYGARSVGAARNLGLSLARERGHEWAAFWDDDDSYLPRYLEQAESFITPGVDALTQGVGFVRFDSGLRLFLKPLHFTPGHCTFARVSTAPEFPDCSMGEDAEWGRRLGFPRRVGLLPPWHMVYNRTGGDHAYRISEDELTACHEPFRDFGPVPDSFAAEPRDLSAWPPQTLSDERVFRSLERRLFSGGARV